MKLRLLEIINNVIQNPDFLTSPIQTEFTQLLHKHRPLSVTEVQNFRDTHSGVLSTYKQYFYEDSLQALQTGKFIKSDKRVKYEARLVELGATSKETLNMNDAMIINIAAKLPITYDDSENIVITPEIVSILLDAQVKISMRLDTLFNMTGTSLALTTIPTPIPTLLPSPVPTPVTTPVTTPVPSNNTTKQITSTAFVLGSTSTEVEAIMGKPTAIQNYRHVRDDWKYGLSSVRFDENGKVNGWINDGNNLKIFLGDKRKDAPPIMRGATQQQVIDAMGTPNSVFDYKTTGQSWMYGKSRIDFNKDGQVKGWINTGGNLKIR